MPDDEKSLNRISEDKHNMPRKVMDVVWDAEGVFVNRPNRFLAFYDIKLPDGRVLKKQKVHVHDPGRLKELCYSGNDGLLKRAPPGSKRKTDWDLIAARASRSWVFIHSAYHRQVAEWVLETPQVNPFGEIREYVSEFKADKHSRLDHLLFMADGCKIAVEVKGCSLTMDGVALFPDAPTERGTRHIKTLMKLKKKGYCDPALLIVVTRPDAECFRPKEDTDPVFADTFWRAVKKGLTVFVLKFRYDKSRKAIYYLGQIPVCEK
jgi:sugar fermentation stimulation protein A